MNKKFAILCATLLATNLSACKKDEPAVRQSPEIPAAHLDAPQAPAEEKAPVDLSRLDRDAFNHAALRLNLPIFWNYEQTPSRTVRPEILSTLNFYPTSESFVWKDESGKFTKAFYDAYGLMVEVMKDPLMGAKLDDTESARRLKVAQELDQAAITVIASDFTDAPESDQAFVRAMLRAGKAIDALYAKQIGLDLVMSKIAPDDFMSQSMARRNWGVAPHSPKMHSDKACRAWSLNENAPVGIYPASLQKDPDFCRKLDERKDSEALLTPFTVVSEDGGALHAVPYNEAYKDGMQDVSNALKDAAAALKGNEKELALIKYLNAAAESFLTNDWEPANEAWAAMNSTNSQWYVRVAPDEVYWEPCSRKAGFHLTFARINPDALAWQEKLAPIQQEMENALANLVGEPYKSRTVSFHLPDFIDIVTNSGDDRNAFGATIGQSLPNWGPVANEGRGRTVAMSNLYTDPDSLRDRKSLASSLFTEKDMALLSDGKGPGLLSTILHEAAHNLGPAHEYQVNGKVDDVIFGGANASLAEEFKAQTAALWYLPMLVEKGVIDRKMAEKSYADSVFWAFGHISRGMLDADGRIQPYSQLSAIQIGMMMEDGALSYDPEATCANGKDKGAFIIHLDKMPQSVNRIMTAIGQIKSKGDKDALLQLQNQHTKSRIIPFPTIEERMLRLPKTSFVYSVKLK